MPRRALLPLGTPFVRGRTAFVGVAAGVQVFALAIESSCDDTAVALHGQEGPLVERRRSQAALHAPHGGVVPELASRDHARVLLRLVDALLAEAGTEPGAIGLVAYTRGPGLVGALLTAAALAHGLAYGWRKPLLGVHHLEGHLVSAFLDTPEGFAAGCPFLALVVSGGHSLLVHVREFGRYEVLGATRDDAAGEAFDKVAQLLGLGYPGGPAVSRLAESGRSGVVALPRPLLRAPGYAFSFSGLKTAVRRWLEAHPDPDAQQRADLALGFEEAVVEVLVAKTRRAWRRLRLNRVALVGGVSANRRLRAVLGQAAEADGVRLLVPSPALSTDNATMIAAAAYLRRSEARPSLESPRPWARARWSLAELLPPPAGDRRVA
jgi:N6-L-threonylcarbamoyladenine synthase